MDATTTAAMYLIPTGHTLVQVFLNEATDDGGFPMGIIRGWRAGDPLRLAASYARPDATPAALAEDAFELCNVGPRDGDDTGALVEQAYRLNGNRSLSVGDVVRVGDTFLACDRFGWTEIAATTVNVLPATD